MSAKRAEKRQKTAADDVAESSFTKDLEVSFTRAVLMYFFSPFFPATITLNTCACLRASYLQRWAPTTPDLPTCPLVFETLSSCIGTTSTQTPSIYSFFFFGWGVVTARNLDNYSCTLLSSPNHKGHGGRRPDRVGLPVTMAPCTAACAGSAATHSHLPTGENQQW